MRAVRFSRYGGPEVLDLVEVEAPHAGPGRIRVAVRAAGVNAVEWRIRNGQMRAIVPLTLPAGIGGDAAGIVDEVGDGVVGVEVGDAVFGSGAETYAEHAVLTSWAAKPDKVPFDEAAGYPTPFETALRLLDDSGVRSGRTVLLNGAAGGVGSAAAQFAADRGVTVIGVAGPANQDYVASLGAVPTTYGPGLLDRVRALAPGGVDFAFDLAGSGVLPELIDLTGSPDRVVTIADVGSAGHGVRFSTGFGRDKTPALREGARLAAAGAMALPVTRTFPLAEVGAAHAASETGHVRGRIVITVP
ncbi:NADP-dependent oxidoreductase [Umezawaea sp. Da 62-37]|uniref:NADP-dependent oxidoreductase n=1 Tax=Umezawaea sp. Da 62-37 TaxID=3075927 RepID=UPI0028F73BDC|nr:NADP-dependent oxidoreductase [Umezawaea sp. Da 62-37]WNV88950.1 NADP-dependent oxidoreductase [Umezawaea sp. Da 62-37]